MFRETIEKMVREKLLGGAPLRLSGINFAFNGNADVTCVVTIEEMTAEDKKVAELGKIIQEHQAAEKSEPKAAVRGPGKNGKLHAKRAYTRRPMFVPVVDIEDAGTGVEDPAPVSTCKKRKGKEPGPKAMKVADRFDTQRTYTTSDEDIRIMKIHLRGWSRYINENQKKALEALNGAWASKLTPEQREQLLGIFNAVRSKIGII